MLGPGQGALHFCTAPSFRSKEVRNRKPKNGVKRVVFFDVRVGVHDILNKCAGFSATHDYGMRSNIDPCQDCRACVSGAGNPRGPLGFLR